MTQNQTQTKNLIPGPNNHDDLTKHFTDRIGAGILEGDLEIARYIERETYINMRKFSFAGHEYQRYVADLFQKDRGLDLAVAKCSQVGLSEIIMRMALAVMANIPGYGVGYLMPSIKFAVEVLKTRMSPIIDGSPALETLINKKVDSGQVKMFNNMSILYALGASKTGTSQSLINRPLNLAIIDEIDRCDENIAKGMRSRQTHAGVHKPQISLSTPTYPDVGIDAEIKERQLHQQLVICHNCKHEYLPDYYTQVELPGYDDPIRTLTEEKLNSLGLDPMNAFHFCPKCHTESKLSPEHRRWVIDGEHIRKIAVKLTPFDAPGFISAGDLVTSQLSFGTETEFRNQALGLPGRKSDSALDITKIVFTNEDAPSGIRIAGMDLGRKCHYLSGIKTSQGILFIDTPKIFTVGTVETDFLNEVSSSGVIQTVCDSLPLLELVHKLSNALPNFWPAIYRVPAQPEPELYKLKIGKNEDEAVRQINIQKNVAFDLLATMLMNGQVVFKNSEYNETILTHLDSMRRVRDYSYIGERYKWVKAGGSSGKTEDHFFHTLLYLFMASKLIGQISGGYGGNSALLNAMIGSFALKKDI